MSRQHNTNVALATVRTESESANKKSPIGPLHLISSQSGCQAATQVGKLGVCPNIFACIKRAALAATPEELERLAADLWHAQASLALISVSKSISVASRSSEVPDAH